MAKQGGMGDNVYVDGFNISGDVGSLSRIGGGLAPSEVTDITQSAPSRLLLQKDGGIDFSMWWNSSVATPINSFHVLKALPTTDRQVSYFRGQLLGNPAASLMSKQIGFDWTRGQEGALAGTVNAQANGFGLEWGEQLTNGVRTDTTATNGTAIDLGAVSTLFGATSYLHVFSLTGTSVVVKVQDSADNATFADVAGLTHTAAVAATSERLSTGITATIRRYIRVITTGTFTNAQFAVNFVRYPVAQS